MERLETWNVSGIFFWISAGSDMRSLAHVTAS